MKTGYMGFILFMGVLGAAGCGSDVRNQPPLISSAGQPVSIINSADGMWLSISFADKTVNASRRLDRKLVKEGNAYRLPYPIPVGAWSIDTLTVNYSLPPEVISPSSTVLDVLYGCQDNQADYYITNTLIEKGDRETLDGQSGGSFTTPNLRHLFEVCAPQPVTIRLDFYRDGSLNAIAYEQFYLK